LPKKFPELQSDPMNRKEDIDMYEDAFSVVISNKFNIFLNTSNKFKAMNCGFY
jgi:hypothetical protein